MLIVRIVSTLDRMGDDRLHREIDSLKTTLIFAACPTRPETFMAGCA